MDKTFEDGLDHVFIHGSKQIVKLTFKEFPDELNIDELTSIDYGNIYGEMVTAPVLLNKLGILKAQAETILAESKLDAKIYEAQLDKEIRKELVGGGERATDKKVEAEMQDKPEWKAKQKKVIQDEKASKYFESFYWAFNSKVKMLEAMMKGVTPEEFIKDIVDGTLNLITITKKDKKYVS